MYVLGGHVDGEGATSSVLKYQVGSGSWIEVAPIPRALAYSTACVLGDIIYVFGGVTNGSRVVDTVYRYDVGANEWGTCAVMPEARHGSRACTMGSMVYVVGGLDDDFDEVASMYRYDPGSDSWSELAPMPVGMSRYGLYMLDCRMHAVDMEDSFVYDPSTDSWLAGQRLNTPRHTFQACTVRVEVDLFDAMIARAGAAAGAVSV
jgi:non-specific serine/threonine protein kinase